jgi:hypothetical protein
MKQILFTTIAILGMVVIANAQTVPSYVPSSGLVGWWPFNGNANDESGSGNNGVVTGATLATDRFGVSNKAYSFNGLNQSISVNHSASLNFSNTYSIDYWVNNYNSTGGWYSTISKDNWWANSGFVYFIQSSQLFIVNCGNSTNYATTIPVNSWSKITVVYSKGTIIFYLNGVMVFSENQSYGAGSESMTFGARHFNNGLGLDNFFNGKIDDIAIYNRALTQVEITDLYIGCQLSLNTEPTNQTINVNSNAQFVAGSSDSNATYQWQTDLGVGFQNLKNVGQYSGTTNDTLTISNVTMSNNNHPFRCIVSKGACSDTSKVAVLTIKNNVGVNKFYENKLFSVYPNPAKNVINLNADLALIRATYIIYDNTGRSVLSGNINSVSTIIELGNLSGGNYVISIGDNMKQSFNVIK